MSLNKKRKYVSIKWAPGGVIGTATHQAVDRWIPTLGATVRAGGEYDLIGCYPQGKIDKNTDRMLRKASNINSKEGRALNSGQSVSD